MNTLKENQSENLTKNGSALSGDDKWLARMLPFITSIILAMTIFFFSATIYQLFDLNRQIEDSPRLQIEQAYQDSMLVNQTSKQWNNLVSLETHVLQQRYHQANVLLMARIWVRYMGFITGMMLAIIGAIFILGKLREPKSELSFKGNVQAQLVTQSPGIVLVVLGSIIMLTTIVNHPQISVVDAPIYIPQTFNIPVLSSEPQHLNLGESNGKEIFEEIKDGLNELESKDK